MIEGQPGEEGGLGQRDLRGGRPSEEDLGGQDRSPGGVPLQRSRQGGRLEVLLHPPVQRAPKARGGGEGLRSRGQRHQPVAVDGFETAGDLPRRGGEHAGQEVRRERVGHDDARADRQGGQEPAPGAGDGLDVGAVRHPCRSEPAGIDGHAIEHEAVDPGGVVLVADAESLEDEQGAPELPGVPDRVLEAEAEAGSAGGGHPVQDVVTVRPHGAGAGDLEPRGGRGDRHQTWLWSMSSAG